MAVLVSMNTKQGFKVGSAAHFQIGTDLHAVEIISVSPAGTCIKTRDINGGEVRDFGRRSDGIYRLAGTSYRLRPGRQHKMDQDR